MRKKRTKAAKDNGCRQMTIWDMIGEGSGYTVKSLFSGAGGLDWGLSQAGLDVVESYEFEKHPCDTLAGLGESDVYKCDISRLLLEGQVCTNLIAATFPCKYYSRAGLSDGSDPLYTEAFRIIVCLSPEAFVIENVPGMRHFDVVMEAFMKMPGYHVKDFVLNASDLGAPQDRKRLIIIGTKKPFDWDFSPVEDRKYLKDILEEGVDMPLSVGARNRLAGKNPGQWPARIYDPEKDLYGPTCVAHYAKDQGSRLVLDPSTKKVRSFTVREYARLQGFPDDYPFAGGKAATLRQIGNAVSPCMAKAIGRELVRYFNTWKVKRRDIVHHTMIKKEVLA